MYNHTVGRTLSVISPFYSLLPGENPEQEGEPEDLNTWEPSNPEPDGPAQSKKERIQTLWKELKLDDKKILVKDPALMKEVKELIAK